MMGDGGHESKWAEGIAIVGDLPIVQDRGVIKTELREETKAHTSEREGKELACQG